MDENAEIDEIVGKKSFVLKLIDWGRAIDMSSLKGHTFRGKAGTAAFDCFEMQVKFTDVLSSSGSRGWVKAVASLVVKGRLAPLAAKIENLPYLLFKYLPFLQK